MSRFVYRGRPKVIQQIPKKIANKSQIVENCGFVILSSRPISNTKSLGCPLVNNYFGTDIIDFHLDIIKMVCKNPEIVVIGGHDIKKILKHSRRDEYTVVENVLHEMTNTAEDLKIGLNATRSTNIVIIDGSFIPSLDSFKLVFENRNSSSILYSKRDTDIIGCELDNSKTKVSYFSFKSKNKIKGMNFLCQLDTLRMRKKVIGSTFNNNKFDFELYDETTMLALEDNSTSVRIDEVTE
jgi:hypothetical protein